MSAMSGLAVARWRLRNQGLDATTATDPRDVVGGLLAVQAENHPQATWAVATRGLNPDQAAFARLYDDGEILRTHVLRPTWHFVLADDVVWLLDLTRPRVQRTWERQLEQEGIDRATWERAMAVIAGAVTGRDRTRTELAADLAAEGMTFSGHGLMLVAGLAELHGFIGSGPRRADEHTYALLSERAPRSRRLDGAEARAELVVRYVTSHGPVTERDLTYWATLPLGEVRAGLADVADQLGSFVLDGATFWHGQGQEPPDAAPSGPVPSPGSVPWPGSVPRPRAHLLQILDEYYRGYQATRGLLDLRGLKPPGRESSTGMTIVDSQIVGDMKRTVQPGRVVFEVRLLRPLDEGERGAVLDAAARYGRFLDREPSVVFV